MSERRLFDPGLQPERTELAWRRTALAIGIASLLAVRLLPMTSPRPELAALLLAPGLIGLVFAALLWVCANARHRRITRALLKDRPRDLPGAGLLLGLTLFVIACATIAALVIVLPRVA